MKVQARCRRTNSEFGSNLDHICLNLPKSAYLERLEVAETIDFIDLTFHQ